MNTPKRAAAATTDGEPPKLPRAKRTAKRATTSVAPALPPPSPVPTAAEMAKLIVKNRQDKDEPKRKAATELVEREAILFEPRMCKPENWGDPSPWIDLFRVTPADRWKFEDLTLDHITLALERRYESRGYQFRYYTQDGAWLFSAYIPREAFD